MSTNKPGIRQEQYAETRAKLLTAARELFAQNGFAATRVREINRRIGMADGLLYHYFSGGKKEILQVIVRENLLNIVKDLRAEKQDISSLPLAEGLERLFLIADKLFTAHLDLFKIFFRESAAQEVLERNQLTELLAQWRGWLPEYLRLCAQRGEIRSINFSLAADTLVAVITDHFIKVLTAITPPRLRDAAYREHMIAYHVALWQ